MNGVKLLTKKKKEKCQVCIEFKFNKSSLVTDRESELSLPFSAFCIDGECVLMWTLIPERIHTEIPAKAQAG